MKKHKTGVFDAVKTAALTNRGLTAGTLLCVAASVIMSLIPPLLLYGAVRSASLSSSAASGGGSVSAPLT